MVCEAAIIFVIIALVGMAGVIYAVSFFLIRLFLCAAVVCCLNEAYYNARAKLWKIVRRDL